jgi:hypothetical protein
MDIRPAMDFVHRCPRDSQHACDDTSAQAMQKDQERARMHFLEQRKCMHCLSSSFLIVICQCMTRVELLINNQLIRMS